MPLHADVHVLIADPARLEGSQQLASLTVHGLTSAASIMVWQCLQQLTTRNFPVDRTQRLIVVFLKQRQQFTSQTHMSCVQAGFGGFPWTPSNTSDPNRGNPSQLATSSESIIESDGTVPQCQVTVQLSPLTNDSDGGVATVLNLIYTNWCGFAFGLGLHAMLLYEPCMTESQRCFQHACMHACRLQ